MKYWQRPPEELRGVGLGRGVGVLHQHVGEGG